MSGSLDSTDSTAATGRTGPFVLLLILVAGTLVAGPDAVPAQELPAPDSVRYRLDDVVVTAHRTPLSRDRVAHGATVLTGEELEARGIHRLSEALEEVPGMHVARNGSFGAATSLFTRGGESDYTRVLVDGIPLNRPGGSFDAAHLTTTNVERVEVVRGPASVLYGSDAMTGVVQVFTGGGEGAPRGEAGVSGGTHGSLRWDASVSGGGETADYSFSLSRYTTDGLFRLNNEYENTVASGRVDLTPGEGLEAGLTLRYSDNAYHYPTDAAGEPVDENAVSRNESAALGLDLGYELTPELEARVQVQTHQLTSATDDRPDGPADTLGAYAFESQQDVDRWGTDARVEYRPAAGTILTLGGSVENQDRDSFNRSESAFGTSRGSMDRSRGNRALYAQAVTQLGPVSLSAGARVDDNEQFGTHDTYRGGATWELPTGTLLRGSVGTGFKEPTFLENYSTGFVTGNPDLDPERSRSWEVGVEQPLLDERLTLSATWFDQRFEDLIQFTFSPPEPGDPNYFNVAAARSDGLEATVTARPVERLELDASYTWTDTEVLDAGFDEGENASFAPGEPLLRRPEHRASARARLDAGSGRFTAGVSWVGERVDRDFSQRPAPRITLDPYATVNVSAEWTLFGDAGSRPDVTPTVRIRNLLDASYHEVANFPTPGRTIFVGLRTGLRL